MVVADDDPLTRRLLQITLPADQFDVVETPDGHECLGAVRREQTDLVVLDWLMPRLAGEETLRELRASRSDLP